MNWKLQKQYVSNGNVSILTKNIEQESVYARMRWYFMWFKDDLFGKTAMETLANTLLQQRITWSGAAHVEGGERDIFVYYKRYKRKRIFTILDLKRPGKCRCIPRLPRSNSQTQASNGGNKPLQKRRHLVYWFMVYSDYYSQNKPSKI